MTDNEMQRMQQEAVRRTREMQRRAASFRTPAPRETPAAAPQEAPAPVKEMPPVPDTPENVQPQPTAILEPPDVAHEEHKTSGGIVEMLFKDKEKTLILGILLLLMDEKTDNGLLLALMYLLI